MHPLYFNVTQTSGTDEQKLATPSSLPLIDIPAEQTPADTVQMLLEKYRSTGQIDFKETSALALGFVNEILDEFLPDGEHRGKNYVALNPTRDDSDLNSFSINTENGLWADFATDHKGSDIVSLVTYINQLEYQSEAAIQILKFIAGIKNSAKTAEALVRKARRKAKENTEWMPILPIPENAVPAPVSFGSELGRPSKTWEYKDADGKALYYVHRFDTATGKEFRPHTFCRDSDGFLAWRLQGPPAPRPAYGLDRLAARPDAPVIFAEGEKAADAAQILFPDFVAVTTMNGAKSPEKTDFTPFAGRSIYFAPDHDKPGAEYVEKLTELLTSAGANVVAVLKLELLIKDTTLSKGYDLADALEEGWTADAIAQLGDQLWTAIPITIVDSSPAQQVCPAEEKQKRKTDKTKQKKEEPKYLTPLQRAEEFAQKNYGENLAYTNNQMLGYASGYWSALDIDYDIKRPILSTMDIKATAHSVNTVVDLLKIKYAAPSKLFDRHLPLICLNNCTLNPVTGETVPHSPHNFLTNKLDISYDPQAKCPIWLQTLDEIFQPDADKAQKIQLLQEFIGYCQIPDTRLPQFLWMVGAGGNGKSLILSIISALIGKANISYAQLEDLEKPFVRAELQGKLVNMSSEMSSQATVADGYLKQITSGDIIQAERKYQTPFSFKPYARIIGATNSLPRLLDHSGGFFRRAIILRLNRQFAESEQDKQREAQLLTELPGILNWAVTGLQALLERGKYLIPESCTTEASEYRINSDPIRQFAEECLIPVVDKNDWFPSSKMLSAYHNWCDENGYSRSGSNKFAGRLEEIGYVKEKRSRGKFWNAVYDPSGLGSEQPKVPSTSPSAKLYSV